MTVGVPDVDPVNDRINRIYHLLQESKSSADWVPGLEELLRDYIRRPLDGIEFSRRFAKVFKDSCEDNTYQDLLKTCTQLEVEKLEKFVDRKGGLGKEEEWKFINEVAKNFEHGPSFGMRDEVKGLHEANVVVTEKRTNSRMVKIEDNKHTGDSHGHESSLAKLWEEIEEQVFGFEHDDVTIYQNATFQNWGHTVESTPLYTCVPKTSAAIQRIVRFAKKKDMGVRCAGFRHSWSPTFGPNGNILISLIDLLEATEPPNVTALPLHNTEPTELETITILPDKRPLGERLVRIGCAVTNERLRQWCLKEKLVTLPFNVATMETTIGGSNAMMCHGAGIKSKTMSDLVRRIEYIDAHGHKRTITENEPGFLRAASGALGLIGIVTHLTLELDPMTYAVLQPIKLPVLRAIPPPADYDMDKIPPGLKIPNYTHEQRIKDQNEFERRANEDYYAEWVWYPYSDLVWVNTFKTTTDSKDIIDWPDKASWLQFFQCFALQLLQDSQILNWIDAHTFPQASTTLISRFAMINLPDVSDGSFPLIKTYLPNTFPFQQGLQNARARTIGVQMPLEAISDVADKNGKPVIRYANVRRAWWDAIVLCYENSETCPQRFPLSMKVTGGSDVILAPQRGNKHGTCSIEVSTLQSNADSWGPYAQKVIDAWMAYKYMNGDRVATKPHWAKEWTGYHTKHRGWVHYTVDGKPWVDKVRDEDYFDAAKEWRAVIKAIGDEHDWTPEEAQARFSNDLWDKVIWRTGEKSTFEGFTNFL